MIHLSCLGFNPNDVALNKYGRSLHFWDWSERKYLKTVDLGADAVIGVRFSTSMIMQNASEMLAFGTAVKLG